MSDEQQNLSDSKSSESAGFGGMLTIVGAYFLKVLSAVLLGFIKGLGFIFTELKELLILFAKAIRWIFRDLTAPMKERIALNRELQKEMAAAKKIDQTAYKAASRKFWKSYIFGKSGLFFTSLNYLLPIISIIILISVIRYGSGIEYGDRKSVV